MTSQFIIHSSISLYVEIILRNLNFQHLIDTIWTNGSNHHLLSKQYQTFRCGSVNIHYQKSNQVSTLAVDSNKKQFRRCSLLPDPPSCAPCAPAPPWPSPLVVHFTYFFVRIFKTFNFLQSFC